MNSQDDPDVAILCVGFCDEPQAPHTRIWFAKWFLELTGEGFTLDAPAVRYEQKNGCIIRTNHVKNSQFIYELTDEYDHAGRRLAVWPD